MFCEDDGLEIGCRVVACLEPDYSKLPAEIENEGLNCYPGFAFIGAQLERIMVETVSFFSTADYSAHSQDEVRIVGVKLDTLDLAVLASDRDVRAAAVKSQQARPVFGDHDMVLVVERVAEHLDKLRVVHEWTVPLLLLGDDKADECPGEGQHR